jgi:adenylate cyclase
MRALKIDETLAEAHRVFGNLKFYHELDWVGAEREYLRAIGLSPNYSAAHFSYTWYLMAQGRFEKALSEAQRGQELDPLSIPAKMTVGDVHYFSRGYDQAIKHYQQVVELEPNYPEGYGYLARAYEQMGKYEDAVKARQKEMTLSGDLPEAAAGLARAYGQQGSKGYWTWRLQKLGSRSAPYTPYFAAEYHAHLGNKDEAIALLEKAYHDRDLQIVYLKVQADWDTLRADPRFQELLRLMNYPEK